MTNVKRKEKVMLTFDEYENFKSVAEKFNIKYDVNLKADMVEVEASKEILFDWGYLEY
jgi:hypothetical protein